MRGASRTAGARSRYERTINHGDDDGGGGMGARWGPSLWWIIIRGRCEWVGQLKTEARGGPAWSVWPGSPSQSSRLDENRT